MPTMESKMGRDRDEFEVIDTRSEKHVSGGRPSLRMPPGLSLWQPKRPGTYRLEFIPFKVTENHEKYHPDLRFSRPGGWYPERTFFVHGGVGVDNDTLVCPFKTYGKPCPICEARARFAKSPHKDDADKAYELRPRERQLFLILERTDRGELERDIRLWEISNFCFGKQLDEYIAGADSEDRAAYKRYFHPREGFTLKVHASEETMGGGGKFLKFSVHEMKPRKEELDPEIFRHGFDLDAILRVLEYDALKQAYLGLDEDDDSPTSGRGGDRDVDGVGGRRDRDRGADSADSADSTPVRGRGPTHDDDDLPPARRRPEPADPAPPPPPKKPAGFASRDVVRLNYRGDDVEGVVLSVDSEHKLCEVKIEAREKPMRVDWDELVLVKSDDAFDAKPAPKKAAPVADDAPPAAARKSKWDDEDDASSAPPPKGKKAAPADDDDPPPAKKRGR